MKADMIERYPKFLPLSKNHVVKTERKDVSIIAMVKDGSNTVLANTCRPIVLKEVHNAEGTHKIYNELFYIHPDDINWDILKKSNTITYCPFKGYAEYYSYSLNDEEKDIAWAYAQPYQQVADIKGYIAFYPDKVRLYHLVPVIPCASSIL